MTSRKRYHIVAVMVLLLLPEFHTASAGIVCYAYDSYAENFIRAVQISISKEGIDPGPIDGKWGSKTENGIGNYQRKKGLSRTMMLDGPTLRMIFGENFKPKEYGLRPNDSLPKEIFEENCR